MFNQVTLLGNLTRDIELRYTQGGTAIGSTAIATTRKFTSNGEKKEEVCFIDITFFGRQAEIANQYLRKGSKIFITGRLKFDQWVDQQGQKKNKHSVIAESMQMLDSKPQEGGYQQAAPAAQQSYAPQQQAAPAQQSYAPQQTAPQQAAPAQQAAPQQQTAPQQQAAPAQQSYAPQQQAAPTQQSYAQQQAVPEININEEDIPF